MSPVLLFGLGAGLGLVLAGRGLRPAPTSLAVALTRLDRTGRSVEQRRAEAGTDRRTRTGSSVAGAISGRMGARVESDLAVMERPAHTFAVEKLATALSLGGIVVALAVVLQLARSPVPVGLAFVLAIIALATGFVTPDIVLRSHASARRVSFRHALSSYLDLVNVLLAGGAGIETSLEAAAQAGDGWAFTQLRNALVRARTLRQSPWQCFTELGDRLGVHELSEIAASVQLAGEQGARVKQSLSAKAAALRGHQMARIEADAQAATERMGVPTVLMFVGFIALLGYPAMQQIVTAL
jgi:pilus assembly protein TadC